MLFLKKITLNKVEVSLYNLQRKGMKLENIRKFSGTSRELLLIEISDILDLQSSSASNQSKCSIKIKKFESLQKLPARQKIEPLRKLSSVKREILINCS